MLIWARSSRLLWNSSSMLLFVFFSVHYSVYTCSTTFQLLVIFFHHISFKFHPSAPYVMTGHMSAFTNFILQIASTGEVVGPTIGWQQRGETCTNETIKQKDVARYNPRRNSTMHICIHALLLFWFINVGDCSYSLSVLHSPSRNQHTYPQCSCPLLQLAFHLSISLLHGYCIQYNFQWFFDYVHAIM